MITITDGPEMIGVDPDRMTWGDLMRLSRIPRPYVRVVVRVGDRSVSYSWLMPEMDDYDLMTALCIADAEMVERNMIAEQT